MILESTSLFLNRDQAAQQLASRLTNYENKNCIVVAVSNGALPIAKHIAKEIVADLTFMPCEMIKDPIDPLKTIGAVSFDYTIIDDLYRDIPQNYVCWKARMLRADLRSRYPDLYKSIPFRFQGKVVILVDQLTLTTYEILTCLKTIQKQRPEKIIVAVPAITFGAAHEIAQEAEELIFIHMASDDSIKNTYQDLENVADEDARELMR